MPDWHLNGGYGHEPIPTPPPAEPPAPDDSTDSGGTQ